MQDLNNNMDDLLRKAAADYPLKTDTSDWDGLQSRLLMPNATTSVTPARSKFNKYGLPLLLVLMLLFLGGSLLKQSRTRTNAYLPSFAKTEVNTGKGTVLTNLKTATGKPLKQQKLLKNGAVIQSLQDPAPANETLLFNTEVEKSSGKKLESSTVADITIINTEEPVITGNITLADPGFSYLRTVAKEQKTKKSVGTIERPAKIYWGFVFGPGINRIKRQKIQKPGFDFGVMAGMPILKGKAAVEAGLLYTQKYYFSDGKYFDMEKAGGSMPQGMEIMSLKGSSRLFELPVKFKYNVLQNNRSGVFLSTGISSYLMTREQNDYHAMMNGSEETMVDSYNNTRRYPAVTVNFAAEFNYKVGTHTRLSIEPYFQIPLKGIGIGSMPVMTTGIHFGFMRGTP